MSLAEKLSQIAKNLEEEKVLVAQESTDQELSPVRTRITELEKQRAELDRIKGSLELQAGNGVGIGMREYTEETDRALNKDSEHLDALLQSNEEVLKSLNIDSKERLVENPEFAQEPEILAYKKSTEKKRGLESSNLALREKLLSLGLIEEEHPFSYDSAESALATKLDSLDSQLLQEKLKTPEGKEEAIEMLAQDLEKVIENQTLAIDKEKGTSELQLNRKNHTIVVESSGKATFSQWRHSTLAPKEVSAMKEIYGAEVVHEALKKAYANKVEGALDQYDERVESTDKKLEAELERSSPEKWKEVAPVLKEFVELSEKMKTTLVNKAAELKEKGVSFSATYASGYGGEYKNYGMIAPSDQQNEVVMQAMRDPNSYPPVVYFDTLKDFTEKRVVQISEFISDIESLETERDVERFYKDKNFGVPKTHRALLDTKFDNIQRFSQEGQYRGNTQEKIKTLSDFPSYKAARDYFEKKHQQRDSLKNSIVSTIETAAEAQEIQQELLEEMKKQDFGNSIDTIERDVSKVEKNKQEATELLTELAKLEAILPQEELILTGKTILVPSVGEKIKVLKEQIQSSKESLARLSAEIGTKIANKPRLWGIKDWEQDVAKMQTEETQLRNTISAMETDQMRELGNKSAYYLPIKQYSELEKLTEEVGSSKGTSAEVFRGLREKLQEIIDKQPPQSVIDLHTQYTALQKKLS